MRYDWSKSAPLETLSAYGSGNVLVFETPNERAEVHLVENNLSLALNPVEKVVFNGTEVNIKGVDALVVGSGNTQRHVYHYLRPDGPALTLRLGITVHNGTGSWSSLPHGFELNTEPGFEEVFFYLLNGGTGRGIQVGKGVWHDGERVDSIWQVHDRTFGVVPMGYHPVVGEPGVNVAYVWAYLAKKKEWEKI